MAIKEYFSHDYFAREDPKFDSLLLDYGWAGYGLYWAIIETLYERGGKISKSSLRGLASRFKADEQTITDIFTKYDLFTTDEENFTSKSACERLKKREEKSEILRQNVLKRYKSKTNVEQMQSKCSTEVGKYKVKDKDKEVSIEEDKLNTSTYTKEEYKFSSPRTTTCAETQKIDNDGNKDIPLQQDNTSFIASPELGLEQTAGAEVENKNRAKAVNKVSEAKIIEYFGTTWEMYPKKVNKIQALKTYKYKLDGMDSESAKNTANKIYSALKKQIEFWGDEGGHGRDIEYIPHFSTWLNANFEDADGKLRCK